MLDKPASVWQHEVCGKTSPVTCFTSRFCRFRIVISTQFNFGPKVPSESILWKDQRCAVQRRWVHRVWIKIGSRQSWGFRWFNYVLWIQCGNQNLKWWRFVIAWGFSLSQYGIRIDLASGWNLCCAAISCMTSHRSFLFVVDCYVQLFNSLVFQCDDMVSKCREMTSRSKPWFEVATQVISFVSNGRTIHYPQRW